MVFFFVSSRRRHTRSKRDWSSDVCSSDLWTTTADNTYLPKVATSVVDWIGADTTLMVNDFVDALDIKNTSMDYASMWNDLTSFRSEERRVGKECRSRLM